MSNLFTKAVDWVGAQLDRIKTISIALLFILFVVAAINNGCQKQDALDLVERITGLNVQNDILKKDNAELKLKQDSIEGLIDSLELGIIIAKEERDQIREELRGVIEERDSLKNQIIKTPTNVLYAELIKEIYPYPGELEYPFNDPQVKDIYLTAKDYELVKEERHLLQEDVEKCELQLISMDSINSHVMANFDLIEEKQLNGDEIILNLEEIIEVKDHEINRLENQNLFVKIGAGIIVVATILLTL